MKKQSQGGIGAQGLPSQSAQGAGAQAASSVAASYEQIQQSMTNRIRPSMYFGSNSNTKKANSSYADRRKRAEELMSRIQ